MRLFAYWPRTSTLPVAKYVLKRYDVEIGEMLTAKKMADDYAAASLDVLGQTHPELLQDLQALVAAGVQMGYDGARLEALQDTQAQFREALPADIKAQL